MAITVITDVVTLYKLPYGEGLQILYHTTAPEEVVVCRPQLCGVGVFRQKSPAHTSQLRLHGAGLKQARVVGRLNPSPVYICITATIIGRTTLSQH